MTLARFSLASAMLHAGAFFLFGAYATHHTPPHAETDVWTVDLKTVLAAPEHDSEATPPGAKQHTSTPVKEVTKAAPVFPASPSVPHVPASAREEAEESKSAPLAKQLGPESVPVFQPIQRWAYPNTMAPQAIIAQLQVYRSVVSKTVSGLLTGKLQEDRVTLDGATGTVRVSFADGAIGSVFVETQNRRLEAILRNEVDWSLVPPPRSFHLPITRVVYSVRIHARQITVVAAPV